MSNDHDKNEPSRFLGEGQSFKAKLIGILEVSEARGDRMCQEALADLKMAIRAAGEHKQRIVIHVAIDGLRLRDEKTGDSLYHHPVHKISFIAQDMSDSRAFGYIFGSPDTGHRFFGIKTDKAASQVVIAMRDLFQVVFELKKKEIELAKQHIEQKSRFGNSASSSLFSDSAHSITKAGDSSNTATLKMSSISETGRTTKSQEGSKSNSDVTASTSGPAPEAIADLVDLELELSSIQQGIHQMERITPSDPFGPNKDDLFHADPFGDSFTSFPAKPYLPPPPSSTKERSARTASESSNLFSPQSATLPSSLSEITSKETSMFDSPTEDKTDWFSQPPSGSSVTSGEITSEKNNSTSEQEMSQERKNSILAQFDVFTELDPLGTGRSKPYVDKKHFFQELKNPPKKVLKDLVGTSSQPKTETSLFQANFDNDAHKTDQSFASTLTKSFQVDPFADEDPFDKTDPFLEKEFKPPPQDPFNTDFIVDFKMYSKQELKPIQKSSLTTKFDDSKTKELIDTLKFPPVESILGGTYTEDNAQPLFSTSPNKSLEKQFSLPSSSPKSFFTKNTFDNKFESKKSDNTTKMSLLHENPSLDMSSESECAPEPPPRPMSNITPIKPPPLPPKKQAGESSIKPPPRPPHTEESHYDYIEQYESAPNSLDSLDKSPPLPIPARRLRQEPWNSGTLPPQRPRKYFTTQSSDEDYLTPIPPPLLPPQKKDSIKKSPRDNATGPMLLPPPQKKGTLKRRTEKQIVPSEASIQQAERENKSNNPKPDIADITLTDLTRTGLDELAKKLNVPANQLSNMTLVQLTTFLSNHLSAANKKDMTDEKSGMLPSFKAEFSVNFSDLTDSTKTTKETYDRYAVFRELLEKDKNENSELFVNKSNVVDEKSKPVDNDFKPFSFEDKEQEIPVKDTTVTTDRYAALREIIVEDLVTTENKEIFLDETEGQEDNENEINKEQNDLNIENIKVQENVQELDLFNCVDSSVVFKSEKSPAKDSNIIEYSKPVDIEKTEIPTKEINKSPTEKIASPIAVDKSPVNKSPSDKSPVPAAITEIIQSSNHLTSGSLSDGVSGSSPEMDNLEESPEVKKDGLTTESWAIFDSPNIQQEPRDKQSEEGVSPWSSDSKEFVTASPTDWRQRKDSGSGGEQWSRRKGPHKDPGWWDEEVKTREAREGLREERERHRRSTDSYDEEFYEMDRGYHPRERRVRQSSWNRGQHSSSSRDVSPWEEEPCRDWNRRRGLPSRHSRDSWDEEDDYEFEEEQPPDHRSWSDRRSGSRERYSGRCADAWPPPPPEDRHRTHRRRHRQTESADHHCCGDWEQDSDTGCINEKMAGRYGNRYSSESWRERDRHRGDDRYYPRNWSQESPWEDEYSNDPDDPSPRYLVTKRTWKRPSSASEMDRKTGENKPRQNHYRMTVSGSDGERDRRYRSGRRARSRDSHYSESNFRHKPETSLTLRHPHRSRERPPAAQKSPFEDDFSEQSLDTPSPRTKYDFSKLETKKVLNEKTTKDKSPKNDDSKLLSIKLNESDSNVTPSVKFESKFKFENDFSEIETSQTLPSAKKSNRTVKQLAFESPSPSTEKQFPVRNKNLRQQSVFENDFFTEEFREKKVVSKQPPMFENDFALPERDNDSPKFNNNASLCMKKSFRQESQFEDDFSPTEKTAAGGDSIGSITEETSEDRPNSQLPEQKNVEFSFPKNNLNDSKRLNKSMMAKRLSVSLKSDLNLKKSESVNIFARENDPFDDDFFSKPDNETDMVASMDKKDSSARGSSNDAPQWTEDFDCFVEES